MMTASDGFGFADSTDPVVHRQIITGCDDRALTQRLAQNVGTGWRFRN
jgi:hypothetical protein